MRRKRLYHAYARAGRRYTRRMHDLGWCSLTAQALRLAQHLHEHYRWADTVGPSYFSFVHDPAAVQREAKRSGGGNESVE